MTADLALRRELDCILLASEIGDSGRRHGVPVQDREGLMDLILRVLGGARWMSLGEIAMRVMHSEEDTARALASLRGGCRVAQVNPGAITRASSMWRSIRSTEE